MNGRLAGRKQRGALGEAEAADYLRRQGLSIVHRNWRCRTGEIDLVAEEGGVLVFVEVRTRNLNEAFGTPQESVHARKQRKILETAQVYIHMNGRHASQIRFDVISIRIAPDGKLAQLDHIRNALG
ncbi:putative endonuclease [Paenibacillus sp. UNCCL117]|uniref:YraN family protein n=1 Tax=unclassified Paenibacillus TaxID=185978 RepID=UPI0008821575|nr:MULTISPECIES: YraN family protein [unclassified Paenibacillus]SDC85668.1 putative endonuclease [Paenibacillus sp. cl123]SFW27613.1 putative endonuclease [Paenibacillus sp. UNCCL117]